MTDEDGRDLLQPLIELGASGIFSKGASQSAFTADPGFASGFSFNAARMDRERILADFDI